MKKYLKTLLVYLPIMFIIQVVLVFSNLYFTSEEQQYAIVPIGLVCIVVYIISNIIIAIWSYKRIHSIIGVNGFIFIINCVYCCIHFCIGSANGYLATLKSFGHLLFLGVLSSVGMVCITFIITLVCRYTRDKNT